VNKLLNANEEGIENVIEIVEELWKKILVFMRLLVRVAHRLVQYVLVNLLLNANKKGTEIIVKIVKELWKKILMFMLLLVRVMRRKNEPK